MQEWLARAASELGLRVTIGHTVTLFDGTELVSEALFPDLSNPLGILVFQETPDANARQELVQRGLGISTFSAPLPDQEFDLDSYAGMFAEWGWTGPEELKPAWMSDPRWSETEGND